MRRDFTKHKYYHQQSSLLFIDKTTLHEASGLSFHDVDSRVFTFTDISSRFQSLDEIYSVKFIANERIEDRIDRCISKRFSCTLIPD